MGFGASAPAFYANERSRRLIVLAAIFPRSPAVVLVAGRADISNVSNLRGHIGEMRQTRTADEVDHGRNPIDVPKCKKNRPDPSNLLRGVL